MTTIIIIIGIVISYSIFQYFLYKYSLKNIIFITTNSDNIQRKRYKIKRKNIINCKWDKNDFIIKTKDYIYKLKYLYKKKSIFSTPYTLFDFKDDMKKIFKNANLNSFRIANEDAIVKFEIIKRKKSK